MTSRLALVFVAAAITSCGTRSELYERDVHVPEPSGALGLSLTVDELFQDCDAAGDGVRFAGTLRTTVATVEIESTPDVFADVVDANGAVIAHFEVAPFTLHAGEREVMVTKRDGTVVPMGGCQLCATQVRVRMTVRSRSPIPWEQVVESPRVAARCTR